MLSGPGMAASYTSFDMASAISTGAGGTVWNSFQWGQAAWSSTQVGLAYDAEHQRMQMSAPMGATYYYNDPISGAKAEWYVPTSGPAQWRDYLTVDGRMVAERVAVAGGAVNMQYFLSDHLGSIAVVRASLVAEAREWP